MNTINREDAVYIIAPKVKLPESMVREVLKGYVRYIKSSVEEGRSISFLRICNFSVDGYTGYIETLSYTCTELARSLKVSPEAVKAILFCYEDCIIRNLKKYYDHTVNGICNISRKEYCNNRIGVYLKRSSSLAPNQKYTLSMRNSFKRKVVE